MRSLFILYRSSLFIGFLNIANPLVLAPHLLEHHPAALVGLAVVVLVAAVAAGAFAVVPASRLHYLWAGQDLADYLLVALACFEVDLALAGFVLAAG